MSINDLFYTEKTTLMTATSTKPNEWGIVDQVNETIAENIPCSLTPIATYHSQQKYGVASDVKFELSLDYIDGCELATEIVVDNQPYQVVSYTIYPAFMCLPKSITYGLKR